MSSVKVAIQGIEGCFHDAAARRFLAPREVEVVPCHSFQLLAETVATDPSALGVMAIENTIAGSLLQNHELILRHGLRIAGEYKMRISHALAALPGQRLEDISEVHSHPMALMQCEEFLRSHPAMRMVERFDTAGSAREIAEGRLRGHAAVCPELAADIYGLEVIRSGIETNRHNFTRFLLVASPEAPLPEGLGGPGADKASLVFTLPHSQGALSKVLSILAFYDLNLTKIQSFPIIGREWEYKFYIDLTFDDSHRFQSGLDAVRPLISDFRILGKYPECREVG